MDGTVLIPALFITYKAPDTDKLAYTETQRYSLAACLNSSPFGVVILY